MSATPPEGKVRRSCVNLPVINPERLKTAKAIVAKAVKSRLVRNEMVYFYWTNRRDNINTNSLQKEQIINHFSKAGSFTTKVGLCVNLRNLHWFDSADPDTFFPRCYRLAARDEKHAFIEDYRRTACISLLKYIVESEQGVQREGTSCNIQGQRKKQSKRRSRPVVLSQMIDSALKVCQDYLESLQHSDIDISPETPRIVTEEEWTEFIDSYYLVVHGKVEIKISDQMVTCCETMLQKLREVSPQLDIDGIHNIWIIKPGAKSRGRGIKCAKRLDQILKLVNGEPTLIRESKWVVQKYLERPLLIHGTKFDVRQWFLVTDWNPLTVWFYKKCYLRFSTQPYSLHTLDSSVHLCNNSIQKHLTPSQQRHQGIPADNMWSDDQFKTFLSSQGRETQWQTVVAPGMKKAVIHALQTTQDLMDSRKNTFELYAVEVPQYLGVHLLVEGFKIKCPNSLPPLRSANRSALKQRGALKEKELQPKMLKNAESDHKNVSSGILPSLLVFPDPPVPVPVETFTPHLPMTVRSIHLPFSTQSNSVFLCKRRPDVSKVYTEKVQTRMIENHKNPLEITSIKQFRPAATSTISA
ncbi:Tubulin monoglycylase TTLL3 [Collichthys lucidus]|uniref:Tubulin monoglycylase TTLL3 n=1 Tax=Collichthys lucidus TaxID=240159 RepID=A0A4U5U9B2_COLLU|nr:Tubulin monoglycylase TTLL3 [Collichthys lucidus]